MVNYADLLANASEGFDPVPSGQYDVEVVKSEPKTSSTGKSMFKVQFKILSGPHAGRLVYNQFVVSPESPNALSFFFQHMKVLGLDATFFAQNPSDAQIAAGLLNARCRITVGQRDWQGQAQNTVKKVLPLPSTGGVPPAPPMPPTPPAPTVPPAPAPGLPSTPF